jgi:hypothetical protein
MNEIQTENVDLEPFKYLVLDENDIIVNSVVCFEEDADPSWIKELDSQKHNQSGVGWKYIRSKNYFLGPIESEEEINLQLENGFSNLNQAKNQYESVINTYAFNNTLAEEIKDKVLADYNKIIYLLSIYETYPYEVYRALSSVTYEPQLPNLNLENEV